MRQLRINETTVICFSHTVRWDETPAACCHTLLQSFCISQGCSMRSGCREELCHYHRNAPLCAFVLRIISIILLANTCDSSSWGISWIHPAIFFFATALSPSNTHFWASPAFCIVLATVCVWMCAEFRFVRRHGLSCQWSSPNSSVQPHTDSHFSSPRQRFLLLSHWFRGLVDRGCALLKRQLHRLRQTVNSALPSRAPPLTIHRGIKGEEGNDVKRQTGSWTPYYLGSVWRTFLKCSARSVLTAVYSWHHPITTLTLQWSRIAEFSAWGPIENLHSETFSVVWVQRDRSHGHAKA